VTGILNSTNSWSIGSSEYGGYSCSLLLKFMLRVLYLEPTLIHLTVVEEAKRSKSLLIEKFLTATMNALMRPNLITYRTPRLPWLVLPRMRIALEKEGLPPDKIMHLSIEDFA
jgi:hypothetical protein